MFILSQCNIFILAEFKHGRSPILVATDVASRGLGLSNQISD